MFCAASGKKISLTKSSIAFSARVDKEMAQKNIKGLEDPYEGSTRKISWVSSNIY